MRLLVASGLLLMLVFAAPAAIAGPVEPQHHDVFLPQLEGCLWSGSYKVFVEGPYLTVWKWSCDPET